MAESARLDKDGELWTFWLDRSGPVNLIDASTADLLYRAVCEANDERPEGLIIATEKPLNFSNGAQLLVTSMTVRTRDDLVEKTEHIRRAYRALRASPVPSVAAITGLCFGCAVELVAHCDWRVGVMSHDAHMYMTEIPDYRFGTAFEGTLLLPRWMGFDAAAHALLWGKRYWGAHALESGFLDGVAPDRASTLALARHLARHGGKRADTPSWRGAEDERAERAHRARIAALPPQQRHCYARTVDVIKRGSQVQTLSQQDYALELDVCLDTLTRPQAVAAGTFFTSRYATIAAHGIPEEAPSLTLSARDLPSSTPSPARELLGYIRDARLQHVRILEQVGDEAGGETSQCTIERAGEEFASFGVEKAGSSMAEVPAVRFAPQLQLIELSGRLDRALLSLLGQLFYRMSWSLVITHQERTQSVMEEVALFEATLLLSGAEQGISLEAFMHAMWCEGVRRPCPWTREPSLLNLLEEKVEELGFGLADVESLREASALYTSCARPQEHEVEDAEEVARASSYWQLGMKQWILQRGRRALTHDAMLDVLLHLCTGWPLERGRMSVNVAEDIPSELPSQEPPIERLFNALTLTHEHARA